MPDQEKCCRENGVPDVCFGYCEKETKDDERTGVKTGICEKWFKTIGKCAGGRSEIILKYYIHHIREPIQ